MGRPKRNPAEGAATVNRGIRLTASEETLAARLGHKWSMGKPKPMKFADVMRRALIECALANGITVPK